MSGTNTGNGTTATNNNNNNNSTTNGISNSNSRSSAGGGGVSGGTNNVGLPPGRSLFPPSRTSNPRSATMNTTTTTNRSNNTTNTNTNTNINSTSGTTMNPPSRQPTSSSFPTLGAISASRLSYGHTTATGTTTASMYGGNVISSGSGNGVGLFSSHTNALIHHPTSNEQHQQQQPPAPPLSGSSHSTMAAMDISETVTATTTTTSHQQQHQQQLSSNSYHYPSNLSPFYHAIGSRFSPTNTTNNTGGGRNSSSWSPLHRGGGGSTSTTNAGSGIHPRSRNRFFESTTTTITNNTNTNKVTNHHQPTTSAVPSDSSSTTTNKNHNNSSGKQPVTSHEENNNKSNKVLSVCTKDDTFVSSSVMDDSTMLVDTNDDHEEEEDIVTSRTDEHDDVEAHETNTTNGTKPITNMSLVDGIPMDQLRLISQRMMNQSPDLAVFYSSLLYAKTNTLQDGLLLAQCHYYAGKYMTCLRIIDETNLLRQQEHPWDAVIIACQAYLATNNGIALCELLEDVCRLLPTTIATEYYYGDTNNNNHHAHHHHDHYDDHMNEYASTYQPRQQQPYNRSVAFASSQILDDDDVEGWNQLKQWIDTYLVSKHQENVNTYEQQQQVTTTTTDGIHPLAQICYYRGQVYYETGCIIRATTYWKRALQIDCQHQSAWESLIQRNLLTPTDAYEWIQKYVTFHEPDQLWLKSYYLARIELTTHNNNNAMNSNVVDNTDNIQHQQSGAVKSGNHQYQQQQQQSSLQRNEGKKTDDSVSFLGLHNEPHGQSRIHDTSSIHLSSPINFLSPGGFHHEDDEDEDHHFLVDKDLGGIEDMVDTNEMMNQNGGGKDHEVLDHVNNKLSRLQLDIDGAFDDIWGKYKLQCAPQVLSLAARRSYRRYDWKGTLKYCEELLQLDPTVTDAAFCYISALVLLGYKRTLFRIAHEWVDSAPKSAASWFAVGSYYYSIQRYHVAQRHYCRATRLDPQCTEAWIAFGCSFAAVDESDQALASYRAAQRISPGEHTSLLYMGMEYVRTNHLVLATYFLNAALKGSGNGDPLCFNELGVLSSQRNEHYEAIQWYLRALSSVATTTATAPATGTTEGGIHHHPHNGKKNRIIGSNNNSNNNTTISSLHDILDYIQDPYWEPTLFNLGHSYRKTRQYPYALLCYNRCISLCCDKYSTYAAYAYTHQLMGHYDEAITYFHQALSIQPDDPFSTEMLNRALHEHTISSQQTVFTTNYDGMLVVDHNHTMGRGGILEGVVESKPLSEANINQNKKDVPSYHTKTMKDTITPLKTTSYNDSYNNNNTNDSMMMSTSFSPSNTTNNNNNNTNMSMSMYSMASTTTSSSSPAAGAGSGLVRHPPSRML